MFILAIVIENRNNLIISTYITSAYAISTKLCCLSIQGHKQKKKKKNRMPRKVLTDSNFCIFCLENLFGKKNSILYNVDAS